VSPPARSKLDARRGNLAGAASQHPDAYCTFESGALVTIVGGKLTT
jgi:hypothetical protein